MYIYCSVSQSPVSGLIMVREISKIGLQKEKLKKLLFNSHKMCHKISQICERSKPIDLNHQDI